MEAKKPALKRRIPVVHRLPRPNARAVVVHNLLFPRPIVLTWRDTRAGVGVSCAPLNSLPPVTIRAAPWTEVPDWLLTRAGEYERAGEEVLSVFLHLPAEGAARYRVLPDGLTLSVSTDRALSASDCQWTGMLIRYPDSKAPRLVLLPPPR